MKKLLSAVVVSLSAASCLVAAPAFSVNGYGSTITITASGERHRIALPDGVGVDMDDAVLLARQQVASSQYLVLFITGPSRRGGNGMGHCGAGIESSVVWLRLQQWRIQNWQHRRVESCWHDESLLEPVHWSGSICSVVFWDPSDDNSSVTLRYDSKKPQSGFSFTKEPFNK